MSLLELECVYDSYVATSLINNTGLVVEYQQKVASENR